MTDARAPVCAGASSLRAAPRGQTVLELALVLPLFITVIVGGVDLARYTAMHSATNGAAREATRYASAVGPSSEAVRRYANCAGIRSAARSAAPILDLTGAGAITIAYVDGDGDGEPSPATCPPASVEEVHRLDQIQVTVTARFTPIIGLLPAFDIVATDRRTIIKEAS